MKTDAAATGFTTDLATPASALVIAAHPDDAEFGAGATLAKWSAAGCVVHHLILTDGSKGTWDPTADLRALALRRQGEQRTAAAALGATGEVRFGARIDGELTNDVATQRMVVEHLRDLRPDVVLGHDPWKRYRLHPDHRHAGQLTVDSIVVARDPHFLPDVGDGPHRPSALLLFEADEVNHLESVSETDLARRCAALEAHESQFETTHFHRLDDPSETIAGFRRRERELLTAMAAPFGLPLGEAFHLMDDL